MKGSIDKYQSNIQVENSVDHFRQIRFMGLFHCNSYNDCYMNISNKTDSIKTNTQVENSVDHFRQIRLMGLFHCNSYNDCYMNISNKPDNTKPNTQVDNVEPCIISTITKDTGQTK